MIITVTPSMIDGINENPTLQALEVELAKFAAFAGSCGVPQVFEHGLTTHSFSAEGELLVPRRVYDLVLTMEGARIDGGTFYSPVVSKSILDNKASVEWGGQAVFIDSVTKNVVTKKLQECLRVWQVGDDQYIIEFGLRDENMNGPKLSHEWLIVFKEKFGGFLVQSEAKPLIEAWQEANSESQ